MAAGSLIAVTGGTGFIGRRFVGDALAQGYRLRLLTRGHDAPPGDGLEHRTFDLGDTEPLDPAVLGGCEAVVHIAAHIPRDHSHLAEAETCWRLNALGTLRLVQGAERAGVRRFLHLTSANAYAPWVSRPDESAPMFPIGRVFYLSSKIAQELYAGAACGAAGIAATTLRVSSVYGPFQPGGAVATLAAKLLRGEAVDLVDGGRFGADFVTVGDVSSALLIVLRTGATGACNIGSGVRSTIGDVAERLAVLTGVDPNRLHRGAPRETPDDGFPALDIARARALGYRPSDLDRGLRDLLTWLQQGVDRRTRFTAGR